MLRTRSGTRDELGSLRRPDDSAVVEVKLTLLGLPVKGEKVALKLLNALLLALAVENEVTDNFNSVYVLGRERFNLLRDVSEHLNQKLCEAREDYTLKLTQLIRSST